MSASPPRFYYGWVNVCVAALAMSATLPGRTYGLGLVKEPIRAELGIGDVEFGLLNFWAITIGAAVVYPAGRMIDRWGARTMLALITGLLGASVLAMARARDTGELAIALTCVRGFGQGALSVVSIALVGKWFRRRAGTAMGVFAALLAVGFVLPIFVVGGWVELADWRVAWERVGWILLGVMLPLGWLFARSSPESLGVVPDEPVTQADTATALSVGQALKTPTFWAYSFAAALFNLTFSAITIDNELLLREHGLAATGVNERVLGAVMFAGLAANGLAGWLAKRVSLDRLLVGGVALMGVSLAWFPFTTTTDGATLYGLLLGGAGGIVTVVYFAVYGREYGRTHLGGIQGVVQVLTVLASAIGPVLLSTVRTRQNGSTTLFFAGGAVLALLAAGVIVWVGPSDQRSGDGRTEVG
jgi:MFS family permease